MHCRWRLHVDINCLHRFFTEYTTPYHKYLVVFWTIMWKWVDPIIMFIIFISSVILEIVHPLTYALYRDVSLCCILAISLHLWINFVVPADQCGRPTTIPWVGTVYWSCCGIVFCANDSINTDSAAHCLPACKRWRKGLYSSADQKCKGTLSISGKNCKDQVCLSLHIVYLTQTVMSSIWSGCVNKSQQ